MISLVKVAFTVAVIVVVINFFKYRARIAAVQKTTAAAKARAAAEAAARSPGTPLAQDLVPCPKCGSYIAAGTACACEKIGG